jgi:MFS family permease
MIFYLKTQNDFVSPNYHTWDKLLNHSTTPRFPFYYGWIIVAVGFITLGVALGVWYSFSVFFLAIIKEFGWSRASASSIFSIFLISHGLMGPLTGHLQDRFGARAVIPAGAFLLAVSLIMTSFSQSLWYITITYGLFAGAGISLMGFTSHSVSIPKWFERQRGLAVGVTMAGIGFGMLLLVPLVERFITLYGWRSTYVYLAVFVLLLVAPLNLILSRRSPADLNLKPDGDTDSGTADRSRPKMVLKIIDPEWTNREWTLPRALKSIRFWLLMSAFICISAAYQGTLLHSVSAMVDAGLNRDTAAFYFGILGIAGSTGKILLGYLSDRFGRERIATLGASIAITGIFCLIMTTRFIGPLPLLFALFFGLGYGAAAPLLPSISADIFFGPSFGLIFAMIAIGGGIGGAIGSYFCGLLRDISGSYLLPLSFCCISLSFSCVFIWWAGPRKVRRLVRSLG